MKMNEQQLAAVRHVDGPCCVIAGAGSGKTAVLVARIQALSDLGVPPSKILAVTFSKKATEEMKERIGGLMDGIKFQVSTFHSLGLNILKMSGFTEGKELIREFQKIDFIKKAMTGTILEEQEAAPKHISSFIGVLKGTLRRPHERSADCKEIPELNELYNIFAKYEAYKLDNGYYDYDDMVDAPIYLLRSNPALLQHMKKRWQYILVDEYQDTNPAQDELLRMIAPAGNNVFVVGDDYQSIYGFRGADVKNILNFPNRFHHATMIYLDINYRCTPEIVNMSNQLIKNNRRQFAKTVQSGRASLGKSPTFTMYADERAEASGVARKIKRMCEAGCSYKDIAILYRVNSVSRVFEEALMLRDIPYVVQGGSCFFEQPYIADVIDYLRLGVDLKDSHALMRVLNRPNRFFGKEFRAAMESHMKEFKTTAWEALRNNSHSKEFRYRKSIDSFANELLWLSKHINDNVSSLLYYIYDSIGYKKFIQSDAAEDLFVERMESIDELFSLGVQFPTVKELIAYADMQLVAYTKNMNAVDAVTLSTVHKSKGLEYPHLFVVTCVDGILPHKDSTDIEEERRIMYVAMTRAVDTLELSAMEMRRDNRVYLSPFVEEVKDLAIVENAPSARNTELISMIIDPMDCDR